MQVFWFFGMMDGMQEEKWGVWSSLFHADRITAWTEVIYRRYSTCSPAHPPTHNRTPGANHLNIICAVSCSRHRENTTLFLPLPYYHSRRCTAQCMGVEIPPSLPSCVSEGHRTEVVGVKLLSDITGVQPFRNVCISHQVSSLKRVRSVS